GCPTNALDTFPCHLLGHGSTFENAVLEILRGDGGYLLSHVIIELPSICVLDRLPLLISERDHPNIVRVSVRDPNRRPPLRHYGPSPSTARCDVTARGRPDGGGVRRRFGRTGPAPWDAIAVFAHRRARLRCPRRWLLTSPNRNCEVPITHSAPHYISFRTPPSWTVAPLARHFAFSRQPRCGLHPRF